MSPIRWNAAERRKAGQGTRGRGRAHGRPPVPVTRLLSQRQPRAPVGDQPGKVQRGHGRGPGVLGQRRVGDADVEGAEIPARGDLVPVQRGVRVGDQADAGAARTDSGQRRGHRHIGVLRETVGGLRGRAGKEHRRPGQAGQVAQRLGLGPCPGTGGFHDAMFDLCQPHAPCGGQRVDVPQRAGRDDELRPSRGGRAAQLVQQRRIGEGRGRGHREIRPHRQRRPSPGGHAGPSGRLDHQIGGVHDQARLVRQTVAGAAGIAHRNGDDARRGRFGRQQARHRGADGTLADQRDTRRRDGGSFPGWIAPQWGHFRCASSR